MMLAMSPSPQHSHILLKWNASLEVGVVEIDNQHKQLVDLLNGLNAAMKLG
jgi:hemerythrin